MFGPKGTFIPGLDFAGIVTCVGSECHRIKCGQAVYGKLSSGPGTWCEHVVVSENAVAPKPINLSFKEAAGIPLVALTVYNALIQQCKFTDAPGAATKRVLIIGASGGVGLLALQF